MVMAPAPAALQGEMRAASGGNGGFDSTPAAIGLGDGVGSGQGLDGSTQHDLSGIVDTQNIWFTWSTVSLRL